MPDPHVIEVAIAPRWTADRERLLAVLAVVETDDPRLAIAEDPVSGCVVLKGVSEAQLDDLITTLQRSSGIAIDIGAPQVAYRETLTRRVDKDYTHKKRIGASGEFARIKMIFEPNAVGGFESEMPEGAVPREFVAGVAAGVASVMGSGILAGFPVMGVRATLVDGAFHDTDSSARTFEIASQAAFREALNEGGSTVLEPIMAVDIATPEAYVGFVMDDLRVRRGAVRAQDALGSDTLIKALVPLANIFGYADQLRAGSRGQATATTIGFSHYAPVPPQPDDDGPAAPAVALRR